MGIGKERSLPQSQGNRYAVAVHSSRAEMVVLRSKTYELMTIHHRKWKASLIL